MPEILRRREARALGLSYYFTGKPCLRGHVCERYSHSGGCCECTKIRTQIYRYPYKPKVRHCSVCGVEITGAWGPTLTCSEACTSTRKLRYGRSEDRKMRAAARCKKRREENGERERERSRNAYHKHAADPEWKRNRLKKRGERQRKAYAALRALEQLGIEV